MILPGRAPVVGPDERASLDTDVESLLTVGIRLDPADVVSVGLWRIRPLLGGGQVGQSGSERP